MTPCLHLTVSLQPFDTIPSFAHFIDKNSRAIFFSSIPAKGFYIFSPFPWRLQGAEDATTIQDPSVWRGWQHTAQECIIAIILVFPLSLRMWEMGLWLAGRSGDCSTHSILFFLSPPPWWLSPFLYWKET